MPEYAEEITQTKEVVYRGWTLSAITFTEPSEAISFIKFVTIRDRDGLCLHDFSLEGDEIQPNSVETEMESMARELRQYLANPSAFTPHDGPHWDEKGNYLEFKPMRRSDRDAEFLELYDRIKDLSDKNLGILGEVDD